MKEALYYEKHNGKIKCLLCPQGCVIDKDKAGICGVRKNTDNKLFSLNYNRAASVSMDPIEKKPLYHFHPGSSILSLGTIGCNLSCDFCQNFSISQNIDTPTGQITFAQAVEVAKKQNSFAIAYTYNEPFIWYEFVLETVKLAKENNIKNVLVTNGFVNPGPLKEILPYIDAANIDLKAMDDGFYRKICGGRLEPVLDTIKTMYGKAHIELTNLVIPALNDSDEKIKALVDWVAGVGEDIPLHFSRYFPCHKMDIPATPENTLKKARQIAMEKLRYVYVGNVADEESDATYCHKCKKPIILRSDYSVAAYKIKEGKCGFCGEKADIIE